MITLHKTLEEAMYFKNSWVNQFYDFSGVHLLPENENAYIQKTSFVDGGNLENWTVNAVLLCNGLKTDITEFFAVEKLFTDDNGKSQFIWSLTNVDADFGYELIYLEIQQAVGEYFYSTPFILSREEEEKTVQLHYKSKRTDDYQSIGFKMWYRNQNKTTDLTTYYETSTRSTVTQAIKTNLIDIYKTEKVSIDSLIELSNILESPYLYVNLQRASLFKALEIPQPKSRENYGEMNVELSIKNNDIYKQVLPSKGDFKASDFSSNDFKIYI